MTDHISAHDAEYKPFPSFEKWARAEYPHIDWNDRIEEINVLKTQSDAKYKKALHTVQRAAAVDTGAIEGLYDTDRGFTITVATMAATWESKADQKGAEFRDNFEAQLKTYETLLDIATTERELTEHLIREIHQTICEGQEHYWVNVEVLNGTRREKRILVKGEYKNLPNHVVKIDGALHAHAPVLDTPGEMQRLVNEASTDKFRAAPPELQISYIHYAFVVIHPFADGNGRVARALASIFSYRHFHIPYFLGIERRDDYFRALERADNGEVSAFIHFCIETTIDGLHWFNDAFKGTIGVEDASNQADAIQKLYKTSSGFTHQEVDNTGVQLMNKLQKEMSRYWQQMKIGGEYAAYSIKSNESGYRESPPPDGYRWIFVSGPRQLTSLFNTRPPAGVSLQDSFVLWVPKDCGEWDDLIVEVHPTKDGEGHVEFIDDLVFKARAAEVMKGISRTLEDRLDMFINRYFSDRLKKLTDLAEQKKNGQEN
ncbi:MAG: Fic family protein [Deltaproteobacteria bacterium]|nr:Fic family protein [Deltaproteobacteria bacterium]